MIALLSSFLAENSFPKWLNGVNANLDNRRPIRVLREGSIADVIAVIEAQKAGVYA